MAFSAGGTPAELATPLASKAVSVVYGQICHAPLDLPLSIEVPDPALSSLGVEECARRKMGKTEALLSS
jgi:hypothetical protein